jgi:hypothetical protein
MATKAKKAPADALANWETCNEALRNATEDEALVLLDLEKGGKRRVQYLLRIHARYNRQRAQRERAELLKASA